MKKTLYKVLVILFVFSGLCVNAQTAKAQPDQYSASYNNVNHQNYHHHKLNKRKHNSSRVNSY